MVFTGVAKGPLAGVVLSHANILSNILGLSQVYDLDRQDRLIGVLPFFESFGLTGTLWYPLIAGFSAVFPADPLAGRGVGELAGKYRATVLLSTPALLEAYTRECAPETFAHLRYVFSGSERLSDTVAREFQDKFGKTPMEGYGRAELSPVATASVSNVNNDEINQVGHKAGMIGHPIPGVSVRIVDPGTFHPRSQGEKGLLLFKGPNVMKGYLDDPERTRAALRDGWFVTGDLARVDEDGFVELIDHERR